MFRNQSQESSVYKTLIHTLDKIYFWEVLAIPMMNKHTMSLKPISYLPILLILFDYAFKQSETKF